MRVLANLFKTNVCLLDYQVICTHRQTYILRDVIIYHFKLFLLPTNSNTKCHIPQDALGSASHTLWWVSRIFFS